jgi:2-Cys peroxiredoxin 5
MGELSLCGRRRDHLLRHPTDPTLDILRIPTASLLSSAVSSTTAAAHSAAVALSSGSHIKVGSTLPSVEVGVDSPEGKVDLGKLQGKNVIVTVPAAFSPSCSDQVPEYIKRFDEFKAKGVDGIYVVGGGWSE